MAEHESHLEQHAELELNDPVMIAAFRGWNDAGDAASFAALHLVRTWSAERLASIDPEEFYDFQAVRPMVELEGGVTRKITWPSNEFLAARVPDATHDIIILVGTEPNIRWRTFASLIVDFARSRGVKLVITLGALLADVPHSRLVPVTGTAVSKELIERLGLQRSHYEGPTGIVGVLHEVLARAGIASASLWAAVPHYLAINPNPKAALALVEKATDLVGIAAQVDDLERATAKYEERVSEMVAADDDVEAYVRMLEERADEREQEAASGEALPTGEALAAELEQFLRERDP